MEPVDFIQRIFGILFVIMFVLVLFFLGVAKISYIGCMGATVADVNNFVDIVRRSSGEVRVPITLKECIDSVIITNKITDLKGDIKCKSGEEYSYIAVYKKSYGFWSKLAFWKNFADKYLSKDTYCASLKNVNFDIDRKKILILKGPEEGKTVIYCLDIHIQKNGETKNIQLKVSNVDSKGEC